MKAKTSTFFRLNKNRSYILLLITNLVSSGVFSASVTFNGTTNTDWAEPTNWSTGIVPTSADIVTIAASKTVLISNITTVNIASLTLNSGSSITNNGILNITASGTTNRALNFNGSTFDNEGTLSIDASTAGTMNPIQFNSTGNLFTFNGTNTLKAATGKTLFAVVGTATLAGSGFIIAGSGAMADYGFITITTAGASLTNNCTSITIYEGAYSTIYLSNAVNVINNGTMNIYTTTTGTSPHVINAYNGTASTVSTFTNYGTLAISGFEQAANFGGTAGSCKFENKAGGIVSFTYPGISSGTASGTYGILSQNNLANVFINSGSMNFNASGNAIRLSALAGGDSFTNSGTISITKGSVSSAGSSIATSPTINNNSGGVINFNYGVSAGTAAATGWAIISNNSGATINGSCTFAAGTLLTAAGSTLSPGDYVGGVSGIGTIVLTPSAAGVKFPLYGNVQMQIKGKTTPGTDFDKISCAEIDVTNATLNVTATYDTYTPAVNDYITLIYAGTSKTGPFSSTTMPKGWIYESVTTNEAAKYYPSVPGAPTAVTAVAGDTQATISFTAPASDGGADITLYTVKSNDGITATGTGSPIVVTGLTNGNNYTFSVTATNIKGIGTASSVSNSVTPTVATSTHAIENNSYALHISQDGLVVDFPTKEFSTIQLIDQSGRTIETKHGAGEIIIGKGLKGMYLLRINTENKLYVQKVIF